MLFSGSNYPTANLFFANIIAIEEFLCHAHQNPCNAIRTMAVPMLQQFEKYWSEHSMILSFAVLLDPRFKMHFVKLCFEALYCADEVESRVNKVYNEFVALYDCYSNPLPSSSSSTQNSSNQSSSSRVNVSQATVPQFFNLPSRFRTFNANAITSRGGKDVVDCFLNSPLHIVSEESEFDILSYWKMHSQEYPVLSRMAKDILAIPITSVAYESSFSLGGRVLTKLRSSLLPKNVEIFVTTSNWLFGFEPEEKHDEYLSVGKEILDENECGGD